MKVYASAVCSTLLLLAGYWSADDAPAPVAITAQADASPPALPVMGREVRILALGDSLFAGYGQKPGESYPARLEVDLRARGINAPIANAGESGDTTAGGLQRLAFTLSSQQQAPKLDRRKIPALLMGMLAPPNLGADYAAKFNRT